MSLGDIALAGMAPGVAKEEVQAIMRELTKRYGRREAVRRLRCTVLAAVEDRGFRT